MTGVDGRNPWMRRRVLPVAHRGGAAEAPENTMAAFRRAVGLGCPMLELDVRATADGEVVILHDPVVESTTQGTGRVADLRLVEVRSLDAAHWFAPDLGTDRDRTADDHPLRGVATGGHPVPDGWDLDPSELRIPTLREVLAAFPRTWITIEIKATAPDVVPYERAVVEAVRAAGREEDVIVASFEEAALRTVREIAPELCTALPPPEILALWQAANDGSVDPPGLDRCALQVPPRWEGVEVVTRPLVALAHELELPVHVWTVDEREEMVGLVELGVDALMSDRPSLLLDVLGGLGVRGG